MKLAFGLDGGELEKKARKKLRSCRSTWVVLTSKGGARCCLKCPERMNKKFREVEGPSNTDQNLPVLLRRLAEKRAGVKSAEIGY